MVRLFREETTKPEEMSEAGRSVSTNLRGTMDAAFRDGQGAGRETLNAGRQIGDFILGEMGFQRNEVSHDPTQIQHTTHRANSSNREEQVREADPGVGLLYKANPCSNACHVASPLL